jgi:hypothetical protein
MPYADVSVSIKNGLVKSNCWRTSLLIMAVCSVLNAVCSSQFHNQGACR